MRKERNGVLISPADSLTGNYQVTISTQAHHAEWDQFVENIPGGNHVQTSAWAMLKEMHSWQSVRVILSGNQGIAAGAQLLVKCLPVYGKIAYITHGPVIGTDVPLQDVMHMIDVAMQAAGIDLLFMIPSHHQDAFVDHLHAIGLIPHNIPLTPRATTIINLEPDLETILQNMKSKTRYNIRYAERKGITVTDGGRDRLASFYEMLQKTGERNAFTPESLEYYEKMFDLFTDHSHLRLLFAEYENQPVSAVLLIAFGDTVVYKRGGWSGEHGNLRPNEALHWHAIQWAKANGFRYYDLEGISEDAAVAALAGEEIPDEALNSYSRFKLGFGGEVVILPKTYVYARNPFIRWFGQRVKVIESGLNLAKVLAR
jgi:lipid II:glycine glycyltransferase (peptidoglycan interpeptide bridge formation enzyme)